jgi:hypothetical protein
MKWIQLRNVPIGAEFWWPDIVCMTTYAREIEMHRLTGSLTYLAKLHYRKISENSFIAEEDGYTVPKGEVFSIGNEREVFVCASRSKRRRHRT